MDIAGILTFADHFGSMGVLVAYLIWDKLHADKLNQQKNEADKALATALALLTASIQRLK